MNNTRPTARQLRQFEQALQQAQSESFSFTDTNLRQLQARRDAYLASLR